jgi:RNA polymerase sigma-70 factor, ECF subfamily
MSTAARNFDSVPVGPPAAASDDHQVWLRVFRQEFDHVYRGLRRQGISEPDAEDLAQEVFLVMWRRWGQLDQQRPMRPWLAAIAFNLVGNRLRRLHREIPAAEVEIIDDRPGAEELLAGRRLRGIVLRALAGLPEKYRSVLVLRDLDGLPMREIAARQSLPLFTAYTRLRRGRRDFNLAVRRLQRHAVQGWVGPGMTASSASSTTKTVGSSPGEGAGSGGRVSSRPVGRL